MFDFFIDMQNITYEIRRFYWSLGLAHIWERFFIHVFENFYLGRGTRNVIWIFKNFLIVQIFVSCPFLSLLDHCDMHTKKTKNKLVLNFGWFFYKKIFFFNFFFKFFFQGRIVNNNTIPAGGIPPQQRPPSSEGETTTTSTTTPWTPTTSWSSTNNQRGGHEVTPIPGTAHLCFKLFNEGFRYPDDILRNQQTVS